MAQRTAFAAALPGSDWAAAYAAKTVLITGADGFIGGHLVARLVPCARSILCVSRGDPVAYRHENVRGHRVDLLDADRTAEFYAFARPDVVFHLASASGGAATAENVLPHLQHDIVTTINGLVAAEKTGVGRFVVPGSTDEPFPAELESGPRSPYAWAKMSCVAAARMFHGSYGTPSVVCRILMAYGPGQKPRKIVPYIVRSLLAGEPPSLRAAGRRCDWVFIDDAIEALARAGVAANLEGRTVEIGCGTLISMAELARCAASLIPGAPAIPLVEPSVSAFDRAANIAATTARLGWSPRTSLEAGLRATIDYYRDRREDTA
jgi:nucleoside-diphosphate-sugar epimerase